MKWQIDYGERPWHRWFAWYPVTLYSTDTRVWLEWVERKTDTAEGWLFHSHRLAASLPSSVEAGTAD